MRTYQTLWQKLMPALFALLLVASILVAACGSGKENTPTPAITAIPTMVIPTATPTPTVTETHMPTITPSLTLTVMPIATPTPTSTPTSVSMNSGLRFIQPVCDIEGTSITTPAGATSFEGHNETVRVYHQTTVVNGRDRVECNIVFKDEDAPVGDKIYDQYRKDKYGRIADIETVVAYYSGGRLARLEFPETYSGSQTFFIAVPQHQSKTLENPSQTVYINTWDHLFAESDTNPALEKYTWILEDGQYKCDNGMSAAYVEGARADAEAWAKAN